MFSIDSTWLRYYLLRAFGGLGPFKSIILDWILLLSLRMAPEAAVPDPEWSPWQKRSGSVGCPASSCMFKCWAAWDAEAYDRQDCGSFAHGCVCERRPCPAGFPCSALLQWSPGSLAPLVLKYLFTALWITAELEHGEAMLSKKPWDIGTLDFESSLKSTWSSGAAEFFRFVGSLKCFEPEMLRLRLRCPFPI